MLTISGKHIILGSIGGNSPALPGGWGGGWMLPPAYDATSVNGKTDICGLVCNVLDIGNRNYFSCIATGAYTVNVYTDATATTLISTQNVASNVQANWQIDYASCTYQMDAETRQAWVEIMPQAGQTLTLLRFNTNHPAETNVNSSANIICVIHRFSCADATNMHYANYALQSVIHGNYPLLSNATNMHCANSALQSVTHGNYPSLTNATGMHYANYALQSVTHGNYPLLTNATNMHYANYALQSAIFNGLPTVTTTTGMFGTTEEATCCRSLRKLILPGLRVGFTLQWTAMQAPEINEMFTSLGTANGAQTIDVRNNPGSATCDASIATAKGFTVLTA